MLSMAEVFIYLMGLSIVLDNLDKPINIAAYCIGFGLGVYAGSRIEEYLALGYLTVQVIVDSVQEHLPAQIRALGYGVTSWAAEGKDGKALGDASSGEAKSRTRTNEANSRACSQGFRYFP